MAGFIPAPPIIPPTLARWEDQPIVPAEPLILSPGQGLIARTDVAGGRLLLDGMRGNPPESVSLYAPGPVAPGILGVWGNRRPSRRALLYAIEANLNTAPTAGDAANHYALRVGDGVTTALLPISTAGVRYYGADFGEGRNLGECARGYQQAQGSGRYAQGVMLNVQTERTITGVSLYGSVSVQTFGPGSTRYFIDRRVRAQLRDPLTMRELSGAAYATTKTTGHSTMFFQFPYAVKLEAGQTVMLCLDIFEDGTISQSGGVHSEGMSWPDLAGVASPTMSGYVKSLEPIGDSVRWGTPAVPGDSSTNSWSFDSGSWAANSPVGLDWPDVLDPATRSAGWSQGYGAVGSGVILGMNGAGTIFAGDVTAEVVAVGTPPAGAAGDGLNVRLLLAGGNE